MTGTASAGILEAVREPLAGAGLDVEDVEISTMGRRRMVRVLVDRDGGVSLDDVAAASTIVADLLDDTDLLGEQPYTLEVTSPGVDRPLTAPRHWKRNQARLVRAQLADGTTVAGRITEVSDIGAVVTVAGRPVTVSYADVVTAKVEIEFSRQRADEG